MRDEVRRLRVKDAQARARFQAVRRLADMATITVAMTEKAPPVGKAGFLDSTSATLGDAGVRFVQAAQLPVNCIIWIAAYSPLWLPLLLGGWYIKKLQTPR
jgi:hypothetical protein